MREAESGGGRSGSRDFMRATFPSNVGDQVVIPSRQASVAARACRTVWQWLSPARASGLAACLVLSAALLGGAGCSTVGRSAEGYTAAVVIPRQTAQAIEDESAFVFAEAGYEVVRLGRTLLFEKRGSLGSRLAYGGLLDEHAVRVRVRVSIMELPTSAHRLQCQAAVVRYPGEAAFEEELKVGRWRGGPYRRLLDRVARNLREQRPTVHPAPAPATER